MKPLLVLEKRIPRYGFALFITAICLAFTLWIGDIIDRSTFQLSVAAVALSAWYGGLGPGLLSAGLSSLMTAYFLLEPEYSLQVVSLADGLQLGVFVLVSVLMSLLSEARHRAEIALQTRTEELEAANKELEAFSYSVSHDLRSPLRLIDNYARVALEGSSSRLSSEVERTLRAIRTTAQQVGQLVDDLLAFSRLGRQSLYKRVTDPAELVRLALDELRREQEGRSLEIQIGTLPPCEADPVLLKQVFVNLLQNALKFTRTRERAQIEIGGYEREHGPVYFIKDNGVGFDMKFTQQLFGMFQRLHKDEEFEGTGVGLAIVQRIILRHGGKIWAEAERDKGAAFYFTLKGTPSHA